VLDCGESYGDGLFGDVADIFVDELLEVDDEVGEVSVSDMR
jgi:hypothetical protein